jgi:hypothetical protein
MNLHRVDVASDGKTHGQGDKSGKKQKVSVHNIAKDFSTRKNGNDQLDRTLAVI